MSRLLVLQSASDAQAATPWLARCLASVRDWAQGAGADYAFHGDAALARAPDWYRDKAGAKIPVVTDLVRLLLIEEALAGAYDAALWLDADFVVAAPERFRPFDAPGGFAVGREVWVDADPKRPDRLKTWRGPHNACLMVRRGDPRLAFLIHATETLIAKADPTRIAPQMVGPKLLKALQPFADWTLLPEAGALSPPVLADLANERGPAWERFRRDSRPLPAGVNLCWSLAGPMDQTAMARAMDAIEELFS